MIILSFFDTFLHVVIGGLLNAFSQKQKNHAKHLINVFYVAKLGVSVYFCGMLRYKKLKMSYSEAMGEKFKTVKFVFWCLSHKTGCEKNYFPREKSASFITNRTPAI